MSEKITGCKPTVNEAHEFLQIAENFKKPLEIIREALSNSWDANASEVKIEIDRNIPYGSTWRPIITFVDDGDGMGLNELKRFFSLGYSDKPKGNIGTKGHGTKIYYKSDGIKVETISKEDCKKVVAETEKPPYDMLKQGKLPTYSYQFLENGSSEKHGTKIKIHRFNTRPRDFQKIKEEIIPYIKWYTIGGSFEHYFNSSTREMSITLNNWKENKITIDNWFRFPKENLNSEESSKLCKIFPTETFKDETTENHIEVVVQIIGCVLGEEIRKKIVPDRYNMGVWLAKDFIKIEKEEHLTMRLRVGKKTGEYYYPNFLILANCQQFNLPANREDIQRDEVYDLVVDKIKEYIKKIGNDKFTVEFFDIKKKEEEREKIEKKEETIKEIDKRMKEYKDRPSLPKFDNLNGAIIKVPKNEKETLLLLQSLISNNHGGIDFIIGGCDDYRGTDIIVEFDDKGTHRTGWLEMLYKLSNINTWWHSLDRIHKIVCWDVGNITPGKHELRNGKSFEYIQKGKEHFIKHEGDFIKVYVLKEILEVK